MGVLDRASFDELVPTRVLQRILEAPPRVIVSSGQEDTLLHVFPEFEVLLSKRYELAGAFPLIRVHTRID